MKILIVAATPPEIAPFVAQNHNPSVEVLITGVGITATTFALTRHLLTHTYDLVLQVGVEAFVAQVDFGGEGDEGDRRIKIRKLECLLHLRPGG